MYLFVLQLELWIPFSIHTAYALVMNIQKFIFNFFFSCGTSGCWGCCKRNEKEGSCALEENGKNYAIHMFICAAPTSPTVWVFFPYSISTYNFFFYSVLICHQCTLAAIQLFQLYKYCFYFCCFLLSYPLLMTVTRLFSSNVCLHGVLLFSLFAVYELAKIRSRIVYTEREGSIYTLREKKRKKFYFVQRQ